MNEKDQGATVVDVDSKRRAGVDAAHVILRRYGYERKGDHFIHANRCGLEAVHVSTVATIVDAALRAALAADAVPTEPQRGALDDPRLQELFMSAITGAMAFGYQGNNRPPAGHWLNAAWDIGRAEAEKSAAPQRASEPQPCTCPSGDGSLRWPCPVHRPEPQPAPVERPTCAVNGLVKPGAMCGSSIQAQWCGFGGECQHKVVGGKA